MTPGSRRGDVIGSGRTGNPLLRAEPELHPGLWEKDCFAGALSAGAEHGGEFDVRPSRLALFRQMSEAARDSNFRA